MTTLGSAVARDSASLGAPYPHSTAPLGRFAPVMRCDAPMARCPALPNLTHRATCVFLRGNCLRGGPTDAPHASNRRAPDRSRIRNGCPPVAWSRSAARTRWRVTSETGAILINAPTLGGWDLPQGPAVPIARTTDIHALPLRGMSRRKGERGEIVVTRIECPRTQ